MFNSFIEKFCMHKIVEMQFTGFKNYDQIMTVFINKILKVTANIFVSPVLVSDNVKVTSEV